MVMILVTMLSDDDGMVWYGMIWYGMVWCDTLTLSPHIMRELRCQRWCPDPQVWHPLWAGRIEVARWVFLHLCDMHGHMAIANGASTGHGRVWRSVVEFGRQAWQAWHPLHARRIEVAWQGMATKGHGSVWRSEYLWGSSCRFGP